MMMIPGAWEARPRSGASVSVVEPLTSTPGQPATVRGGTEAGPETERPELPAWLKVSIFAGTLLVATWLAMTAFF